MTRTTLKSFIAQVDHARLIRAVVKQCGGWESFTEMAEDVANHGAGGGFHGFIYYVDTVAFTRRNRSSIMDYAAELSDDIGEGGVLEIIANFVCLRDEKLTQDEVAAAIYTGKGDNVTSIYNALAWFALEEVSRWYSDMQYEARNAA